MAHTPNAFENQIFNHFRENAKQINNSRELLVEHNYTVIDLEGKIINKSTIHLDEKPDINYKKAPKQKQEQ